LLSRECFLAQLVPTLIELAFILVGPLLGHVVRSVHRARSVILKERLVGSQRLLLANPLDRLGRHVTGEVVALLGLLIGLDGRRSFPDCRKPLVRLTADKAIEVFKPATA